MWEDQSTVGSAVPWLEAPEQTGEQQLKASKQVGKDTFNLPLLLTECDTISYLCSSAFTAKKLWIVT